MMEAMLAISGPIATRSDRGGGGDLERTSCCWSLYRSVHQGHYWPLKTTIPSFSEVEVGKFESSSSAFVGVDASWGSQRGSEGWSLKLDRLGDDGYNVQLRWQRATTVSKIK